MAARSVEVARIVREVINCIPGDNLGIHAHNDTGQAISNSLAAVLAGVRQVQGTLNGIGERCGNADLISIIPTLILKPLTPTVSRPASARRACRHLAPLKGV